MGVSLVFKSLLIANRGEIACRVMRTARKLGVRSVAVYSEADAEALHVRQADEAYLLGPAPAGQSYLDLEAVLAAARASGAEAIHPGYGFLSENADFAEACATAGIVFVGPPPAAIRAMGSKSEAKVIMEAAGVPLVPGYHGEGQEPAALAEEAERIGYPVLIKASAGGGGKGMRIVEAAADFEAQLAAAKREAAAAFTDDRVLIEKYLERPRHIEVQVFADQRGQAMHLFERDCSIQRRHQKVIEEAPAPGLSPSQRADMGAVAVSAAKAIGYQGAGTVEFIAEDERFYFMEMNTRLQVEHPVTEMVTGLDLVEWQLRVAAGEPLPKAQEEIVLMGHAFEARLYAEDPERDFLPATGRLSHLSFPDASASLRVDAGVETGDAIGIHYDPMIAKIVVHGRDRATALGRLADALARTEVVGVKTNLALLESIARHPAFAAFEVDTGFIERNRADLFLPMEALSPEELACACLAELLHGRALAEARAAASGDPTSPWNDTSGWRLNAETQRRLVFLEGENRHEAVVHYRTDHFGIETGDRTLRATGRLESGGRLAFDLDGRRGRLTVVWRDRELDLLFPGGVRRLVLFDPLSAAEEAEAGSGSLTAPMPGKIAQVLVSEGVVVERGTPLVVMEAMKMEHTLAAPARGRILALRFAAGDTVEEGTEIVGFEVEEG